MQDNTYVRQHFVIEIFSDFCDEKCYDIGLYMQKLIVPGHSNLVMQNSPRPAHWPASEYDSFVTEFFNEKNPGPLVT